jgi:hypothetical protein
MWFPSSVTCVLRASLLSNDPAAESGNNDHAPQDWWTITESPKAWMSVRDADLYEALLHRLVALRGRRLRIVEWGAGRSTVWYTRFLDSLGASYTWLSVEHHREFVDEQVMPALEGSGALVVEHGVGPRALDDSVRRVSDAMSEREATGASAIVVASFDHGLLRPDLPDHEADREADLSDYVALPARVVEATSTPVDLAVIDGRHRRRCLLAASDAVASDGYVIQHDAWRLHYQCAWRVWRSGRRFGDEWWIGAQCDTNFTDILPWHALERHADSG